ncbi:MAG: aldo/keto reductase [Thermodesulfobacteriota bacterium]
MKYRRLGRSGLNVSILSLGTMNFGSVAGREESIRIIDAALDLGINLIDCADVYSQGESERVLGEALKKNNRRKDVFITSKVFWPAGEGQNSSGGSRHHIFSACEKSLRSLKTDFIDIYFLHRSDFNLPQEESLAALDLLVQQGKIRYVGCSTHPPWRVVEAIWIAEKNRYPKYICEQPPYNLLDRRAEIEIFPMCQAYDMGIMTWSPLAQGVLAGRYHSAIDLPPQSRGAQKNIFAERITQQGIEVSRLLAARATEKGCSLPQLALGWVLHQPPVTTAIIGPRTLDHLKDLHAAVDLHLDDSDIKLCDSLVPPEQNVSNHFNTAGWRASNNP